MAELAQAPWMRIFHKVDQSAYKSKRTLDIDQLPLNMHSVLIGSFAH